MREERRGTQDFAYSQVKGINPARAEEPIASAAPRFITPEKTAMPNAKSSVAHADLDAILVSETSIKRRLKKLGADIATAYGDQEITVVAIINGAILFTADLLREIPNPIRLDCIRISSYRNNTKSHGKPQLLHSLSLDISNRHVLLIDDILDTGKTLSVVVDIIKKQQPASVRTCVLLDKKGRREVAFEADFVGFEIPDKFVVGYGLDFAERYRNLPCIGVLKSHLQNPPEWA
jgi:hypoxanthine phosphoribosyltransferase